VAVLPLSAPCVVKTSKFTHITLSVKSLNWLKINDADVIRTYVSGNRRSAIRTE